MILLAYTQDESEVVQLDLSKRETVQLNYSVAELGDVTTRNSPFSQTFKLPTSERNNKYFEHFYDANLSAGTFDTSKKARVQVLDQGVQVIAGYLQLRSVSLKDNCYSVAVYGDAANLFQEIEKKDLREVFVTDGSVTTDYDYSQTSANVVSSFDTSNDITTGTVGNGVVIVPLMDHGRDNAPTKLFADSTSGYYDNLLYEDRVFPQRFKPAINVKHLLDLILSRAGYSRTSSFMDSSRFGRLYMQLGTDTDTLQARPFFGFRAGLTSDQTISSDGYHVVQLTDDTSTGFYDPDGLWDATNLVFTAPQNMTARFGGNIYVSRPSGSVTAQVAVRLQGATSFWQGPWTSLGPSNVAILNIPSYLAQLSLVAGEEVQCLVAVQDLTGGNLTIETDITSPVTGTTNLQFASYDNNGGDIQIHLPSQMPEMTQAEFVREIVQRFNLVLEASADNERHLLIEPHSDWLDLGTEIDWTEKLDLSKQIELSPTNEYRQGTILMTDAEGKDETNVLRQEANGHVFGQYKEYVDDDFAQGELKIESKFKPVHVHELPLYDSDDTEFSNVLIPRLYSISEDGKYNPIADKPFLFYHNGLKDIGATFYIESEAFTQYPYVSAFDSAPNSETTESLYWDYQWPSGLGSDLMGDQYVHLNCFRVYWARFINQIYHPDARLLKANFYLKPTDILNLKFNSLINVRGTHYRLLKVNGYTVNTDGTTQCELIKDQGTLRFVKGEGCDYIPDVWNIDGTIRFVNPETGATTYTPGEACCENAGGIYDPDTTKCFYRTPRDGGSGVGHGVVRKHGSEQNASNDVHRNYTFGLGDAGTYNLSLYGQANESRTVQASTDGEGTGAIQVLPNTLLQGRIMVNTVQTTFDGTNGARGSSEYIEYAVSARNVEGATSVTLTEIADARITDGDATGNRSVAASISGNELVLTCTGETYARVAFFIDTDLTYQQLDYMQINEDVMLTEAGDDLVFENLSKVIPG